MNLKIREIIGCLISVALLVIYAVVLWDILDLVKEWKTGDPEVIISGGQLLIVNGVGGLVSAVVIMTLGITKKGYAPTATVVKLSKDLGKIIMAVVTIGYVLVWLILAGFVIYHGVIESPEASTTINELGKTWIGLVIGAGYAYFGINP